MGKQYLKKGTYQKILKQTIIPFTVSKKSRHFILCLYIIL